MGNDYSQLLNREKRVFDTPDELLAAAVEYFQWCEDHPLLEEELFHNKGQVVRADKKRMRPFTKRGLAVHLGIPMSRLGGYKQRDEEEWGDVVELIEDVIFTQKFDGAAAGMLNASIIGRDLGLADKQELSNPDGSMKPPTMIQLVAAKPRSEGDDDDAA